jgi:hypothetical protein
MAKVVFASSREGTEPICGKWNWNGLPFLDLYQLDVEGAQLKNAQRFYKALNGNCKLCTDAQHLANRRTEFKIVTM